MIDTNNKKRDIKRKNYLLNENNFEWVIEWKRGTHKQTGNKVTIKRKKWLKQAQKIV